MQKWPRTPSLALMMKAIKELNVVEIRNENPLLDGNVELLLD